MQSVLTIHLITTVAMAGLIWFVQLVHYPLFAMVGREGFVAYESAHARRTTWVVAPLMLAEAGSAIALVVLAPSNLTWVGLALVMLLWTTTAVVQVPCHRRLARGFDEAVWSRLVATNWLRTLLWSTRVAVAAALVTNGG